MKSDKSIDSQDSMYSNQMGPRYFVGTPPNVRIGRSYKLGQSEFSREELYSFLVQGIHLADGFVRLSRVKDYVSQFIVQIFLINFSVLNQVYYHYSQLQLVAESRASLIQLLQRLNFQLSAGFEESLKIEKLYNKQTSKEKNCLSVLIYLA